MARNTTSLDIRKQFEQLKHRLEGLPAEVADRVSADAVAAGAEIVAEDARSRAPRRTGLLAQSISVGKPKKSKDGARSFVIATAPHAHLVEFGTAPRVRKNGGATGQAPAQPFMRPALETNMGRIVDVMAAEVEKVIKGAGS